MSYTGGLVDAAARRSVMVESDRQRARTEDGKKGKKHALYLR